MTAKLNTTWLKLAASVEAWKPFRASQAIVQPSTPPRKARATDSSKVARAVGKEPKPSALKVASSRARAAIDAYIAFRAANTAPMAISTEIGTPIQRISVAVSSACSE